LTDQQTSRINRQTDKQINNRQTDKEINNRPTTNRQIKAYKQTSRSTTNKQIKASRLRLRNRQTKDGQTYGQTRGRPYGLTKHGQNQQTVKQIYRISGPILSA
jgi:hypothetical protein